MRLYQIIGDISDIHHTISRTRMFRTL